jgi:hypothetical protein
MSFTIVAFKKEKTWYLEGNGGATAQPGASVVLDRIAKGAEVLGITFDYVKFVGSNYRLTKRYQDGPRVNYAIDGVGTVALDTAEVAEYFVDLNGRVPQMLWAQVKPTKAIAA